MHYNSLKIKKLTKFYSIYYRWCSYNSWTCINYFYFLRINQKVKRRKKETRTRISEFSFFFFFFLQPLISFFIDAESRSITFIHDTHPYRFRDNLSRLESNREHLSFDVVLSWVSLPKPNTQREFRLPFCIYRIATHGTLSSSGENLMYAFQPLVRWFRAKMMYIFASGVHFW